jgi:transposase
MSQDKYIGMDVHQASISVAVPDGGGKLIMECVLQTQAGTILEFIRGMCGSLAVSFEEGTWAAWLHGLRQPHVGRLIVCDPRKNARLKEGSKSDRIDARKLAELLRGDPLSPVYHGDHGVRTLKELARSYLALTQDLTRVMTRIQALYRSWAIPCSGGRVYAARHRGEWLGKIAQAGVRRRAERLYNRILRGATWNICQSGIQVAMPALRKEANVQLTFRLPHSDTIIEALGAGVGLPANGTESSSSW